MASTRPSRSTWRCSFARRARRSPGCASCSVPAARVYLFWQAPGSSLADARAHAERQAGLLEEHGFTPRDTRAAELEPYPVAAVIATG